VHKLLAIAALLSAATLVVALVGDGGTVWPPF
jgi:hypothetical protein